MSYRPVDMPLLRAEARESVGQRGVRAYTVGFGHLAARQLSNPEAYARRFAAHQTSVLRDCGMFYVDEKMALLAEQAARTLDTADLYETDLPAPYGLIYFERPIGDNGHAEVIDDLAFIVSAASWCTLQFGDERALLITWFCTPEQVRRMEQQEGWSVTTPLHRLNQHLFTMWRFGNDQTILLDGERTPINQTSEGRAIAELFSVWHIMRQPLVKVVEPTYDRAALRRLKRENLDPAPVRVITLRRISVTDGSSQSDREFHFQWIVRGHWRQQWYPSAQAHRPVWIAPHVKGPEGAPLLGGEKVYALKR